MYLYNYFKRWLFYSLHILSLKLFLRQTRIIHPIFISLFFCYITSKGLVVLWIAIKCPILLLSPNSQGFKVFIRIFAVQIILLFPKITIFLNLWDILSSRVNRKSKAFEKWQKEGFFCECVWRAGREWRSLLIIATKNRLKSKIGRNGRVNCLETKFWPLNQ